ncbi:unnamed protein product [Mytilus edulis]|uniref:TIR domain-containing protein n=1 Tax=Mytilus edulis TaxID=6550 RepID=A0A8S3QNA8_MYTED|nr:unnamed protein product [Mytilus edulis]
MGSYTYCSIDGMKDLWCKNQSSCYTNYNSKYGFEFINQCLACEAIPEWEIPLPNVTYLSLDVEITNVEGTVSMLLTDQEFNSATYFRFMHSHGYLKLLPRNICEFNIVFIDVGYNLFQDIGNISCLQTLDTLKMNDNRITFVSNKTFAGMPKLRYVDLSSNKISKLDFNILNYPKTNILHFYLNANNLRQLDVGNVLVQNNTICRVSYKNNKYPIKISNIKNFNPKESNTFLCGTIDFSNVRLNIHPFMILGTSIGELVKFARCGNLEYRGAKINCDCSVAEFFNLEYLEFNRMFSNLFTSNACQNPEPLRGIHIKDLFFNTSLHHLMICDLQDGCPKVGNCKCVCTSHPLTDSIIIDCSNQSCTDLPEVVPKTRHRIVLLMEGNQIQSVNSKYYFKDVKSLDLAGNPVQGFDESIQNFTNAAEIIIVDHLLDSLPRQAQLLDPNVFRFGQNSIPCNCDNRWIGEWRKFKEARYPLFCSNDKNVLIEDFVPSTDCVSRQHTLSAVYSLIPLTIFIFLVLFWKLRHLRYDVKVLKSQFLTIDKNIQRSWQTDVYISFDEDNDDVRWFVFQILDKFCRRKVLSTYIACRDSWPGSTDEQNIVRNLQRCKYCLIIQSSGMYDLDKTNSCSNRMEYRLAWDLFTDKKLCKVFIINFDKSKTEEFQAMKTKALYRLGMGFKIYDRKRSLYEKLLEVFNEPLVTNAKHIRQRKRRISAYLWQQFKDRT